MIQWLEEELASLLARAKALESTAVAFLLSFFKEAVSEEEAALFPAFKAQTEKLFEDEAKMAGLFDVKDRVALAVAEGTADLAEDIRIAKNALFHSWAWAIAHDKGLLNGNQGNLQGGVDDGGSNAPSTDKPSPA